MCCRMKSPYLYIILLILIACSKPKPQRPVEHRQMQLKESLIKEDFELDKQIIEEYIAKNDSLTFKNSENAFWWASVEKDESAKTIDSTVQIDYTYSVYNFKDQEIYSKEDIGTQYAVIGKTRQIRALTEIFEELSEGEKAILLVPSFSAYGFSGDGNKIGPAQPIIIKLEIIKLKSLIK